MGKEFLKKNGKKFKQCRERDFEEKYGGPDLFSKIEPTEMEDIAGWLVDGQSIEIGDELYFLGGTPEFYKDITPVVRLTGGAAQEVGAWKSGCIARVASLTQVGKRTCVRLQVANMS